MTGNAVPAPSAAWRTLLVHLDGTPRTAARTALALAWARAFGAHVVGLAPIAAPDVVISMRADVPDALEVIAYSAERRRLQAHAAADAFAAQAADAGVSFDARAVPADDVAGLVVAEAAGADVVLVGQRDAEATLAGVPEDLPQQLVLRAGRPVVVVPTGDPASEPARAEATRLGGTVVAAWRARREAAVALRDALPLLARAGRTLLVEVTPDGARSADGAPPPLGWLARHGVVASHRLAAARGEEAIGNALLAQAADCGAELLVMGGYGHSRLREWVLGGVTRHVLANLTLPVLLAH